MGLYFLNDFFMAHFICFPRVRACVCVRSQPHFSPLLGCGPFEDLLKATDPLSPWKSPQGGSAEHLTRSSVGSQVVLKAHRRPRFQPPFFFQVGGPPRATQATGTFCPPLPGDLSPFIGTALLPNSHVFAQQRAARRTVSGWGGSDRYQGGRRPGRAAGAPVTITPACFRAPTIRRQPWSTHKETHSQHLTFATGLVKAGGPREPLDAWGAQPEPGLEDVL